MTIVGRYWNRILLTTFLVGDRSRMGKTEGKGTNRERKKNEDDVASYRETHSHGGNGSGTLGSIEYQIPSFPVDAGRF